MKKLFLIAMMMAVGCMDLDSEADVAQDSSIDPYLWIVGQWDCDGSYLNVPPFTAHNVTATYTVTQDVPLGGQITGRWVETSDPRGTASNFSDMRTIDSNHPDQFGRAPVTYTAVRDAGGVVSASGLEQLFDDGGSQTTTLGSFRQAGGTLSQYRLGVSSGFDGAGELHMLGNHSLDGFVFLSFGCTPHHAPRADVRPSISAVSSAVTSSKIAAPVTDLAALTGPPQSDYCSFGVCCSTQPLPCGEVYCCCSVEGGCSCNYPDSCRNNPPSPM